MNVSIVITTHNRAALLARAVTSAHEAGSSVEVIVVDDASTDRTFELFSERSDIRYIRLDRNLKTAGARNVGLMAARSPYVSFLDDDDWRLPGSIDKQIEILDSDQDCHLVYGQFLSADQNGNLLEDSALPREFPQGDVFWRLMEGNFIGCLTVVVRKDTALKIGLLDTSPLMNGIEDLDLWIRFAELYRVGCVKEPVAVYRMPGSNTNQWSSNQTMQYWRIAQAYKRKWLKLPRVEREFGVKIAQKSKAYFRSISEVMLYDIVNNTPRTSQKLKKAYFSARCFPANLVSTSFYKTIVRSLLSNENNRNG